MKEIKFYRCEECGNIVALIHKGGGTLVCCGQDMTELKANTTDAALEKHVPAVSREDGKVKVQVGSTLHPMLPEHYIMWVALISGDKMDMKFLEPGGQPIAEFEDAASGMVFEYCSIHGLWKADF